MNIFCVALLHICNVGKCAVNLLNTINECVSSAFRKKNLSKLVVVVIIVKKKSHPIVYFYVGFRKAFGVLLYRHTFSAQKFCSLGTANQYLNRKCTLKHNDFCIDRRGNTIRSAVGAHRNGIKSRRQKNK